MSGLSKCGALPGFVLMSLVLSPTYSQTLPELLRAVDSKTSSKLHSDSNHDFRRQLYFAKRHRVVDIDFTLLEESGTEFTITPFADIQLKVVARDVRGPSSADQLREWQGELVTPFANVQGTDSRGAVVAMRPARISMWIRSGDHEVPIKLVREIASERSNEKTDTMLPYASDAPASFSASRVSSKLSLTTVSARWPLVDRGTTIVLEPNEDDPRYRVVYEEDPSKVARGDHMDDQETDRLEKHQRFLEQLEAERAAESDSR